ncbi:MAG: hypothetical protein ABSG53_21275 [Thermoguttaceae bacterium]
MSTIPKNLFQKPRETPENQLLGPALETSSDAVSQWPAEKRKAMAGDASGPDGPSETGQQPTTWPAESVVAEREEGPCALDPLEGRVLGRHVKTVFCCWTVIFSVVGAQMAWVLRPYFGTPNEPFVWFGPRTSNFFEGVWQALHTLLWS